MDNTCILWDLETGQTLQTLRGHTSRDIRAVSITPDGQRAISGSLDNTCILWDLGTGQVLKTLKGHYSTFNAISITPDGKRAICCSIDDTCILWDLETGKGRFLRGSLLIPKQSRSHRTGKGQSPVLRTIPASWRIWLLVWRLKP